MPDYALSAECVRCNYAVSAAAKKANWHNANVDLGHIGKMKILCFCMVCSSSNVLFFSWAKLDDSNVPSSTTGEGKRSHRSLSIQLKQMISLCTHTLFGRAQCY